MSAFVDFETEEAAREAHDAELIFHGQKLRSDYNNRRYDDEVIWGSSLCGKIFVVYGHIFPFSCIIVFLVGLHGKYGFMATY